MRGSISFTLIWVGLCLTSLCTRSVAQQTIAAQGKPSSIQINVTRVLVPVVVRDRQGRAVDDLKRDDFQVLDEGKPRPLSGFTLERRGTNERAAADTTETGQSSQPPAQAAPQSSMLPDRITVFLFDDMHLSPEDLGYAKQAGIKALDGALTGSDVAAVVSTSGKTNSGLTRDHANLQNAIATLQLHSTNQFEKSDCPYISYYQADLMLNENDSHAVQDALAQVLNCDPGINPQTDLPMARRGSRSRQPGVLLALASRTRKPPTPSLQRLCAEWPTSQGKKRAAQSNLTISALDARGFYTTSLTASEDVHAASIATRGEFVSPEKRAAENAMGELADGTGGTISARASRP
jgi:VWFA-related protein